MSESRPSKDTRKTPPELIDTVIDCASDSVSTLKACSLVSRSWLPRARTHLFRSMNLHFHEGHRPVSLSTYLSNLRLCILSVPEIVSCVEHLSIFLSPQPDSSNPSQIMNSMPENLPFNKLKTIDIGTAFYGTSLPAVAWRAPRILSLIQQNPDLETISLFGSGLGRSEEPEAQIEAALLAYVTTRIPGLKSLRLCEFDVPRNALASAISPSHPIATPNPKGHLSNMQSLALEHCQFGLAEALFPQGGVYRFPSLASLVLLDCNRPDPEGNFKFVNRCPGNVRHLVIALSEMENNIFSASFHLMFKLSDLVLYWSTPQQVGDLLEHIVAVGAIRLKFLRLNQLFVQNRDELAALDSAFTVFISKTPSLKKILVSISINQHNAAESLLSANIHETSVAFPESAQTGLLEVVSESVVCDMHGPMDK